MKNMHLLLVCFVLAIVTKQLFLLDFYAHFSVCPILSLNQIIFICYKHRTFVKMAARLPQHLAKIAKNEEKRFTEGIKKLVSIFCCAKIEFLSSFYRAGEKNKNKNLH